jgi:hypothetical protein
MQQLELYDAFIRKLETAGIRYMVTGSIASIFYGEPRLTHDIDIILFIGPLQVNRFIEAFPEDEYYCPPKEIIQIELKRDTHAHFNLIHHSSGLKADCYPFTGDALHEWAADRIQVLEMDENRTINLAPPEYVILRKLEFYAEGGSDKHLRDIRAMLNLNSDRIDFQFLEAEIAKRHLNDAYQKVK